MAVYSASIISFTTKTNKVDLVDAAHINLLQVEMVAVQTKLGKVIEGTCTDLKTRLAVSLGGDGAIRQTTTFSITPSPIEAQLIWRSDLDTLYAYTGSAWQALGQSQGNLLFLCEAQVDSAGSNRGETVNSSLVPSSPTGTYRFRLCFAQSPTYVTLQALKWVKISGVNTVIVKAQIWNRTSGTATLKVEIGTANNTVTGTDGQTSPEWVSMNVDVSALVVGTTYDVTISMTGSANENHYLGNLLAFGS